MSKDLINVELLEQSVEEMTKFEFTASELTKMAFDSKLVVAEDLKDTEVISKVADKRKELRTIAISIEKTGKSYRDIFNKTNKDIIAKERELTSIINPEIDRLKKIEDDSKELLTREVREKSLPDKKVRLNGIGDKIEITDDELLAMTETEFYEYESQRITDKNEVDRLANEEEKNKLERDKEIIEAKEKAVEEEKVKAGKEAKEKEEKEKQDAEKLSKEVDYQKFLSDNGFNEKEFTTETKDGEIKLYKLVATYKIK